MGRTAPGVHGFGRASGHHSSEDGPEREQSHIRVESLPVIEAMLDSYSYAGVGPVTVSFWPQ
jgi:hypothetical protein